MSDRPYLLTPPEKIHRNKQLRKKKYGMLVTLLFLFIASGASLYLLQLRERPTDTTLYTITAAITAMLLIACLFYYRFAAKLALDLQSVEKIIAIGTITRVATNTRTGVQEFTFDMQGRLITLSMRQLQHLVPDVIQTQRLMLYDRFVLEFTPHGNHLMRATRL